MSTRLRPVWPTLLLFTAIVIVFGPCATAISVEATSAQPMSASATAPRRQLPSTLQVGR